jgi:hypothetical protein
MHEPASPRAAAALADVLRAEGLEAGLDRGVENRGAGQMIAGVAMGLAVNGTYDVLIAGVQKFLDRFPTARVKINGRPYDPRHKAE